MKIVLISLVWFFGDQLKFIGADKEYEYPSFGTFHLIERYVVREKGASGATCKSMSRVSLFGRMIPLGLQSY